MSLDLVIVALKSVFATHEPIPAACASGVLFLVHHAVVVELEIVGDVDAVRYCTLFSSLASSC
jgi:hypothetical protein